MHICDEKCTMRENNALNEHNIMFRPARPNVNQVYAEYGMQACRKRYPMGGLNIKEVYEGQSVKNRKIYLEQLTMLVDYNELIHKKQKQNGELSPHDIRLLKKLKGKLKGAFCGGLALLTRELILKKFPRAVVENVILDHHELLVIGRHADSNPDDILTWGNDAVFLDPWAKLIYPVSKFSLMQKKSLNVEFYHFGRKDPVLHDSHYLSGHPKIAQYPDHDHTQVDYFKLTTLY